MNFDFIKDLEIDFNESVNNISNDDMWQDEFYLEASTSNSTIIRDEIYPIIESVLSTPEGNKLFAKEVEAYINRHSEALHEPCPITLIPFADNDKAIFFGLFGIKDSDIKKIIHEMTTAVSDQANFKLVRQNPIFTVFYCCIRFYTLKNDQVGINRSLIIYALSAYPSIFSKYFKHGANPGVMKYTADTLTNKFIIKQQGHVFGALNVSIQNSYKFLKPFFKDGNDTEVIRFIQRIRNDQNSMIKKIANEYNKNYKAGKTVYTKNETYDGTSVIDDQTNDTSVVEDTSQKVVLKIVQNGVNLKIAETAAKWAQVSIVDLRFYLTKIILDKNIADIQKFIESVLFIYLYINHHTKEEIKSKMFLSFAIELFRKTNSNDDNIRTIKLTLDKWAEDSGVHSRFKREASRVSYKKGIFWYIILSIQYVL